MNGDIKEFETNRRKGENESIICSLIREDSAADFIQYVNKNSISLSNKIKRSIFETNSMLIEKAPTLMEYAAFFGSIQIIRYLEFNQVVLEPSIWLYAVHSNNPELIHFLEEKHIEMDNRTFSEAIKCHHNSIAHYIFDNCIYDDITKMSDQSILSIYSSLNFEFFSNEIDGNNIFFGLLQNGYYEFIDLYMSLKEKKIEDDIKDIIYRNYTCNMPPIICALQDNLHDVGYYLLSQLQFIPENYFKNRINITKIAIPSSITSFQNYSFYQCSSLEYISFISPSSITSIGDYAFCLCNSLKEITIPSSLTLIGNYSFYQCLSLTQIIIPSSVISIGIGAFSGCLGLVEILFAYPSSVTSFENDAFSGCSSLKNINVPSSVTSFGDNVFYGCSSLKNINVPSSVTSIGKYAFYSCSSLAKIIIPSSTKSIGSNDFLECSSLKYITIPPSIKKKPKIKEYLGIPSETEVSKFY